MTTLTHSHEELRHRLGGGLFEPGEPEYEDACALFNSMIEVRPALVARCIAPDDVAAALSFARNEGLEISVRAGGHSVAGLSLNDGGIVLDIRPIDEVVVDPERRLAKAGGGATLAQLDRATQEHGLATTGGRVSSTGIGGLTLGGGSGWLERKHGFACDNLVSAELVSARGELVRASADENPDLFWALKGGGGNFGVVTAFEYELHPVGPEVYGGMLVFPFDRGREVMRAWRDLMLDAPEDLSLAFAYIPLPDDDPELPDELLGQFSTVVAGMYNGDHGKGASLLDPLREGIEPQLDAFGPIPYVELQSMLDDPPGFRNYWTAEQLRELPEEAIERLYRRCEDRPNGMPQLFMPAWGGALSRVTPEESALGGRDSRFIVHPLALWEDPADDEEAIAWARSFREDMAEFSTGGSYLNFTGNEGDERVRAQYGETGYERIAAVKRKWDPENVFRASGNPAPGE